MKPLCAVWSRGGRHFSQRVGGVYGHSAFDNSERCLQAKGGREEGREGGRERRMPAASGRMGSKNNKLQ